LWDTSTYVVLHFDHFSTFRADVRRRLEMYRNPGVRTVFGDRLKALGKDLSKTGAGVVGLDDAADEDEYSEEE